MKVSFPQKHKSIKRATLLGSLLAFALLNSCEYNVLEPPKDCTTSDLSISLTSTTDANCGLSNGAVELSATGTAIPLTFSLGGANQSSGNFEGLAAGSYTATVEDADGCTSSVTVSIANADGVSISSIDVEEAGCNGNAGKITITATGGTTPYSYSLDGGSFQESNVFSGLSNGSKNVTVKDAAGCEFSQGVTIGSGVSFSATIEPIIQTRCAISGCHNGSRFPDLRTFSSIQTNASRIKARTGNKSMPQGSSLSQEQIDAIACWVDDGALNN